MRSEWNKVGRPTTKEDKGKNAQKNISARPMDKSKRKMQFDSRPDGDVWRRTEKNMIVL